MTWLWQGYLAPRQCHLAYQPVENGKTTLLAILLARMKAGGTLAFPRVVQATTWPYSGIAATKRCAETMRRNSAESSALLRNGSGFFQLRCLVLQRYG
jgi:hypothetical protein